MIFHHGEGRAYLRDDNRVVSFWKCSACGVLFSGMYQCPDLGKALAVVDEINGGRLMCIPCAEKEKARTGREG